MRSNLALTSVRWSDKPNLDALLQFVSVNRGSCMFGRGRINVRMISRNLEYVFVEMFEFNWNGAVQIVLDGSQFSEIKLCFFVKKTF